MRVLHQSHTDHAFEHAESLNFVNTRNGETKEDSWKREKHVQTERSGSQLGNKRILIRVREKERGSWSVEGGRGGKGGQRVGQDTKGCNVGSKDTG